MALPTSYNDSGWGNNTGGDWSGNNAPTNTNASDVASSRWGSSSSSSGSSNNNKKDTGPKNSKKDASKSASSSANAKSVEDAAKAFISSPNSVNTEAVSNTAESKAIGGSENVEGQRDVMNSSESSKSNESSPDGFENNYADGADFSWVTGTVYGDDRNNKWKENVDKANAIKGYDERKLSNWTYKGDLRASDDKNASAESKEAYNKYVAPVEMEKAWNEANERNKAYGDLVSKQENLNNMRNEVKNIGAVLENTKQPEDFKIGESTAGKNKDTYNRAMYEYAQGMLNGNQVDDFGEPMPYWGNAETIDAQIEEAEEELSKEQRWFKNGHSTEAKVKEKEENLAKLKETKELLNNYLETYKDRYEADPDKGKSFVEFDKKSLNASVKEAEANYNNAIKGLQEAQKEYSMTLSKLGFDWVDYEEVVHGIEFNDDGSIKHVRATDFPKEVRNAASEAMNAEHTKYEAEKALEEARSEYSKAKHNDAKAYELAIMNAYKAGKITSFEAAVELSKVEDSQLNFMLNSNAISMDDYKPSKMESNTTSARDVWAGLKEANGKVAAVTNDPEGVARTEALNSANVTLENGTTIENFSGLVGSDGRGAYKITNPDGTADLIMVIPGNKDNLYNYEVRHVDNDGNVTITETRNSIPMTQIDKFVESTFDRIVGKDNFVPATEKTEKLPGTYGPKGEEMLSSDSLREATTNFVNPEENSAVSSIAYTYKTSLEEYAKQVEQIGVDSINNLEDYKIANDNISALTSEVTMKANEMFRDMVEDLLSKGGKLQDISKNENLKNFSNDLFALAQSIYDKTSAIEERTSTLGLNDLSVKEINKNIDVVSDKVARLAGTVGEKGSPLGSYYSPGSDLNGKSEQPTGITMSKEDVKALADYGDSIVSTKDAAIALMKSAAFNGAENTTGEKWSEAWKAEAASEGLKAKDYVAASLKGTLGITVAALGGAAMAVNPAIGTMLLLAGIKTATETGMKMGLKGTRAHSTNAEAMFGSGEDYVGKNIFNDIYNRSYEKANIGDIKSVGTYTTSVGLAMNMLIGVTALGEAVSGIATGNPAAIVVGAIELIAAAKEGFGVKNDITTLTTGGVSGATNNLIRNVYSLGNNIIEWSNMDINIQSYMNDPDARNGIRTSDTSSGSVHGVSNSGKKANNDNTVVESDYGTTGTLPVADADATYSGFKEQAKNSNLATDYNAGMEQEANEAVSDEKVKGYIVRIYSKEPDWFRSAIDKVLKMHSEREW